MSRKQRTGHRSHISGKRSSKYAAKLKDKLVKRAKELEKELVKK